jgi:hypothetical protein
MADRQLVLSFFPNEAAADAAASTLKALGLTSGDAMGVLVLDGPMDIKVDKVGARSTAAGAGVGACLLLLGPAVIGVGIVGGTIGGALHHKGLKLTDEDKTHIVAELQGGKAAVGVLADFKDAGIIEERLTALGGASSAHEIVDDAALAASAAE